MAEVCTPDGVRLHVETDGSGEPVTVFAHGLTNSCSELAAFTPFAPGTAVRFCFRGHGHSLEAPQGAYGFADFAADVRAVADTYGATRAVGTSLGAGAITHLLGEEPGRFERLVFLLPAALDRPLASAVPDDDGGAAGADESLSPEQIMVRQVVRDVAVADRGLLRAVTAPVLLICREGDVLHPAELGRALAGLFPNAELVMLGSEDDLVRAIPELVQRVSAFLA